MARRKREWYTPKPELPWWAQLLVSFGLVYLIMTAAGSAQ